jgi:hypothetical protein
MRNPFATAVASLTILAVASAQVAALASQSADVVRIPVGFTINPLARSLIQACVGEAVSLQGTSLMVANDTYLPDGSLLLSMIHFNGQGAVAVGLTTGTVYRIVGADTTDIVFAPGTLAASFDANLLAIGPGSANSFMAHILQHVTVTPNGEITSEIDVLDISCR